jgi:hypothetical protein
MVLYEKSYEDYDRGLIGFWKLDDLKIDTAIARDTAKFNDGTIDTCAAATDQKGITKNATSFDGLISFIDIPHSSAQLGAALVNGFTITAWIFPISGGEGGSGSGRILDKSSADGGANGFCFYIQTNKTIFLLNNGTSIDSTAGSLAFNTGKWYHVAVTVTGAVYAIQYVNGVPSGTPGSLVQTMSKITTTNNARIGNRATGTDKTFDGRIANLRWYNRVLTANEINRLYKLRI